MEGRTDERGAGFADSDGLIAAANDTRRALDHDESLDALFAAQAQRSPAAPAILWEGEATGYGGLLSWADGIAGRLRAAGGETGDLVGVCGTPSPAVIAGVLGILRAGCAYVPLESDWPAERLRFMARDCGVRLVVCDAEHESLVTGIGLAPISAEEPSQPADPPPKPDRDPGDLAYVLYTSGSTGEPKGVAVPHRAVNRLISGAPDYVALGEGARFLWLSPLTFDASVIEIWGPLLTGGAIVVMPAGEARLERLAETIRRDGATAALFISPQLHMVVDRDPHELEGLRHILVGGDVLSADHVRRLLASGVVDEVVHCYGPTESTLFATVDVIREVRDDVASLPIGKPIANTTCHVVDDELRPLPVGEEGELLIGGLGLATGYINRPELTAEKFVVNPFSPPGSGERLYRTGDLARWREDGRLEFGGRIDHQVKIRGYRIELGEIEAVLRDHAEVEDCVVVAREDEAGHRRLVAYLTGPERPDVTGLRSFAGERLPAYMVPAAWILLDELPLTRNNKVDRAALPDADGAAAGGPTGLRLRPASHRPPGDELEGRIASLFGDVLRVDDVGRDDGFFELGGDSLLVTEVLARLGEETGVRLPLDILVDAPTPATLAAAIERARARSSEHALPPLVPQPRTEEAPLSVSQEQICFLNDLDPTSVAYQFQAIVWLQGELDPEALERALGGIVARHEIWRSTFQRRDGRWRARIHEPFPVDLDPKDLSDAPDPDATLAALADAQFRRRIPIDELPLVRWRLVRLGPTRHALLHQEHHLVHDGWSMMVFVRELRELYAAEIIGEAHQLRPMTLQFRDFAVWQRALLETEIADRQLAYWRERLADPPDPMELPYDRSRPARQTFRGDQEVVDVPGEVAERMREFARSEGVTPFMTMLAAFYVLLDRYSGAGEVIVGSGMANRRLRELDAMLGMFINTVALRVDLSDDPTVSELLGRVRVAVLEAQENQDVPFPRVVEAVAPARSSSHTPLYQTLFSIADAPLPDLEARGLRIDPDETPGNGSAKAEVNVVVVNHEGRGETPAAPTIIWEYNGDLFSAATARRMVGDYCRVLEALVSEPSARTSTISLLADDERRRLLVEWNDTAADYPRDATIDRVFAGVARRAPEAIAVTSDGDSLTYAELDRRSNRLARHLRARGIEPGSRVGISTERAPEMVVGLLGILKAGAAYVPLDPSEPDERRDFARRDAGISVVLDPQSLRDPAIASESDAPVEAPVSAADEAYVMYTSGSTGQPKGVMVSHRNVVRLVRGQCYADFGADEVFLQMAPLAFDASTFEIWGALLHGARLVLYPAGAIDLTELRATLRRHGVTTLWLTAGLFHQVVDTDVDSLSGLRQLLAGGDALLPDRVSRAMRALPGVRLVNGYGPTEATTFSCCFDATSGVAFDDSVPIGRPIANTSAYVLDDRLEPVPVGVPGELYIGGDGVALGYLNERELTAERFIESPFGEGRLYRTGDMVRWRPDRQLEFLGREDLQVKVRGFRVEPGEVEAALVDHPGVREAAVVAPADANGDRRMIAFVVAEQGIGEEELRSHVAAKLPPYMVPSTFAPVERLPVTPNGKVDRGALADRATRADLSRASAPQQEEEDAPGQPGGTQALIAGIWAEVLGVESAGPDDDFFASGGHSLLAMRLIHDVNEACDVELTVRSLLVEPTLGALVREVERAGGSAVPPTRAEAEPATEGHPPLVPIRPEGYLPPLFLVAGGMGGEQELLVYARLTRYLNPEQPFYGLRARGVDDLVEPHQSVEAMAAEHLEEIRKVQPRGPYYISGSCVGGVVAYELAQQLRADGEEVPILVLIDSNYPTRPRMIRNQVLNLWKDTLPPGVARPGGLRGMAARAQDRARVLFSPTEEQRIGMRRSAIGNRYLRRILRYRPEPYEGKLVFLACEEREVKDAARVWKDVAAGGLEVRYLPGDHYTHLRDHAAATAATLDDCLRRARDQGDGGANGGAPRR
ncbi:MAG TPA: amino acid adenylation domain-containing protein [Solirubrobacterales bacterium]|nr:amino acid adenylation domain-containing protein [Solirubrobacterales bacterium]